MLFKQIDEIVRGQKTQTRRLVKEWDYFEYGIPDYDTGERKIFAVFSANAGNGRLKWQVGQDYAVTPGRGKPGVLCNSDDDWMIPEARMLDPQYGAMVRDDHGRWHVADGWTPLRIRITAIRQERLQDITEEDAIAEGCPATVPAYLGEYPEAVAVAWYHALWNTINIRKGTRWQDNPLCWCISFEVVR